MELEKMLKVWLIGWGGKPRSNGFPETELEVLELSYFNEEEEIQKCSEKRILRGFITSNHLSNS